MMKAKKMRDGNLDYPPPMEPDSVNRSLIRPRRRKNDILPSATAAPSAVMWTHMEQNMFELQVAAAENGSHPPKKVMEDPYEPNFTNRLRPSCPCARS